MSYPTRLPDLAPSTPARRPRSAERVLDSGLRVLAVRRASVPLVEARLRIPFAGRGANHPARSRLLSSTMLFGTSERTELQLADALAEVGSDVAVSADADRLVIGAAVLRTGLGQLLDVLAELLTDAAYPADLVAGERGRVVDQLQIARSQPSVRAREARSRLLFGTHPYGRGMPSPGEVAATTAAQVRRLHRERVRPFGATLVLVGDLPPARMLDEAEKSLQGWLSPAGATPPQPVPAVPPVISAGILLLDRPGAVQSTIRIGGPAIGRQDPDYAAMQLANMIFGGYFSSRFVENVREDKGYSYSPRSSLDQRRVAATVLIDADVATDVTAPALLETRYELGRMATLPVTAAELDSARNFALGTLALSTSTQAGLASTLAALVGQGLDLGWLAAHRRALLGVTVADVLTQAQRFLAPSALVTVVVGDSERTADPLSTVDRIVTG